MESVNTFDDVNNILKRPIPKVIIESKGGGITHETVAKLPIADRLSVKHGEGLEGTGEGGQARNEPGGGVRNIVPGTRVSNTGVVESRGRSKDIVGDIVEHHGRGRPSTGDVTEFTRGEGVRSEELPGQFSQPAKQPSRLLSANIQEPYVPQSKGNSGGNLVPKNLIEPIANVLQKIENTYGDVDTFVQNELQYKTKEALYEATSYL